jgi:hypothetical protein
MGLLVVDCNALHTAVQGRAADAGSSLVSHGAQTSLTSSPKSNLKLDAFARLIGRRAAQEYRSRLNSGLGRARLWCASHTEKANNG